MDSSLPLIQVYIISKKRDENFLRTYITEPLKDHPNKEFRVQFVLDKECNGGNFDETLERKTQTLQRCHHVLIIATTNTGDKPLVPYNTRLALERTQSSGLIHVALIIVGRSVEDLSDAFGFAFLRQASTIKVKVNRQFWEPALMKDLIQLLTINYQDGTRRRIVLPSVAEGLAWAFYLGFLKPAAQEIGRAIFKFDFLRQGMRNVADKLFVLISQHRMPADMLSDLHDRFQHVDTIEVETTSEGQTKNIHFHMYTIEKGDEIFFFMCHVATEINVLNILEDATEPLMKISKEERCFLIKKVVFLLNLLLNDTHTTGYPLGYNIKLIYLDEPSLELEKAILPDAVFEAVVPECKPLGTPNRIVVGFLHEHKRSASTADSGYSDSESATLISTPISPYPAYLVICQGSIADSQTANVIIDYIPNGTKYALKYEQTNDMLQESMVECRWCILILSPTTLLEKRSSFEILKRKWLKYLHERIAASPDLRVVAVLSGIGEEHVTLDFRAMICLNKDTPDFLIKLYAVLTGGNISMDRMVSGKNAYQAFALHYVYEYLTVFLEAFGQHLQTLCEETTLPVLRKLIILVPGSCQKSKLLSKNQNERVFNFYSRSAIQVNDTKTATLEIYRLRFNYKTHLVALEFPAPVTWLREMTEMVGVSGLSGNSVYEEAYMFKDLAQRLVDSRPNLSNKAKILYYDDVRLTLVDALTEALEDEEFQDRFALY